MRIKYTHTTETFSNGIKMQTVYDQKAPKKATNLSVNSDLLKQARELKINLSSTFEQALSELIKAKQKEKWISLNKESINAYNNYVEQNGEFSKNRRRF